ncbi:MAG: gamma-glutamylcyclotransferase [Oceanospirillaceae bacterium]|nr:gamma-glutamylcyclotransferase [Oceanospirillaceae bacterium]
MDRLFTYGTLMIPEVIDTVLGRPAGCASHAELPDYACFRVRNCQFPAILAASGHATHGRLYQDIAPTAFQRLDLYEGALYQRCRVCVRLDDGRSLDAWTYVLHGRYRAQLTRESWDYEYFVSRQLEGFLKRLRGSA